jgi:hypothetical protein
MTIEVISFIIGGILIGTAVVGGGFEIREIKMPRVGAGVRITSLVVGSGFLLLSMGMWSLNNPHLLADSTQPQALMTTTQTDPAPQQSAATADVRSVAAEQPAQQPAAAPDPAPAAAPGFTGFTGDTYLSWQMEEVDISAAARFAGMNGLIRISWVDPSTGMQDEVLQDLVLQQDMNGVIFYQGVNPRYPSTEQPRQDYRPDQFRVVANGQGWTIDQICDVQACWPVYVR